MRFSTSSPREADSPSQGEPARDEPFHDKPAPRGSGKAPRQPGKARRELGKALSQLGTTLREQWIFGALLGVAFVADSLLLANPLMLPGVALLVAAALLARHRPVHSGLAAAVLVGGSSVLAHVVQWNTYSLGLGKILPTENIAGLLIVLYLFWKRRPTRAIPVATLLVAIFVLSESLRAFPHAPLPAVGKLWSIGALQLILAVGTGLYLRGKQPLTSETPMQALLRRQWPVMALLVVVLFLDALTRAAELPLRGPVVLGCAVMAALAIFAPLRPVETAFLGAGTLVLTALIARVMGIPGAPYLLGGIPITATVSGMVLLAFAARHAPGPQALWAGGALVLAAVLALLIFPAQERPELQAEVIMGGLLLILSVGAGMYFRSRDEERSTATHAAVSRAQQVERMALARELHDVVAHHVTGIVVQAQAAQLVGERSPQAAHEALKQIDNSGTEALTAMRRLVASMRDAEPVGTTDSTETATTNLESDLRSVVARAERDTPETVAPPQIELTVEIDRQIAPEVARSALRIVQESLTNATKYAVDASRIEILVSTNGGHLRTRITDDGVAQHAHATGGSGGYGLVGMRERVELLGGRFHAKPGDHVGWRVEAWLPLSEQVPDKDPDKEKR